MQRLQACGEQRILNPKAALPHFALIWVWSWPFSLGQVVLCQECQSSIPSLFHHVFWVFYDP